MGALVRTSGVAQRSKTATDVCKSGTSGAGGTKFLLGGTQRTHEDFAGATYRGSADAYGVEGANYQNLSRPTWSAGATYWHNSKGRRDPQRTHMGPLVQPTRSSADLHENFVPSGAAAQFTVKS